ncbi:MAG: Ldh family oxidoreductase [Pirellulaceae bacterium]
MPHFTPEDLEHFSVSLLAAGGASAHESQVVGASLIDANIKGYDSHGLMRIPFYLDMLKSGDIVSGAELATINETSTMLAADANWGFGRVQCGALTEKLLDKAEQSGVAIGTLRHSSHIGRLGEYCEIAASRELVSIMMVNTHGAARRVAPPGGRAPRLGTNPIAMGVPSGDAPLVLDFSTSVTAEGKVRMKSIAGETCPEGWLLDSDGNPTTDPNDLYTDPPGSILPMGGPQAYKGFGLSLMIDLFSGALSGGLCARETPITPKGNCVFMMAVNPAFLGGTEAFEREVTQLVDFVRNTPTAPGTAEILLPGDPERQTVARNQRDGLSVDDENWGKLWQLAETLGVEPPT